MKCSKKTKYTCGESLSELLIASLIISLAMIMLFSGVKVGSDIMAQSRDENKLYNEKSNQYEEGQAAYVKRYYELYPEGAAAVPTRPADYSFTMSPVQGYN